MGRAVSLHAEGRLCDAATECERVLHDDPTSFAALHLLGAIRFRQQAWGEAERLWRTALRLQPSSHETRHHLALTLDRLGRVTEAHEELDRLLREVPEHARAHACRSLLLLGQDDVEAAAASAQQALERDAQDVENHRVYARVLAAQGKPDAARSAYQKALALAPHDPDARYDYARLLLQTGSLQAGWQAYEGRLEAEPGRVRDFGSPRWDGSDLGGRRLLVYPESDVAETLHFVRYLGAVTGGHVTLASPPQLARLLRQSAVADAVVEEALVGSAAFSAALAYDLETPLLSLPHLAGGHIASQQPPWLRAHPGDSERWAAIVSGDAGPRIGLAWRADAHEGREAGRHDVPPRVFAPLVSAGADFTTFWLQSGGVPGEAAGAVGVDHTAHLGDMAEMAALIANLDLVIAADSAVACLALALKRPLWLLVHHHPDWRWRLLAAETDVGPGVRFFRQEAPGDWDSVAKSLSPALDEWVREGHAKVRRSQQTPWPRSPAAPLPLPTSPMTTWPHETDSSCPAEPLAIRHVLVIPLRSASAVIARQRVQVLGRMLPAHADMTVAAADGGGWSPDAFDLVIVGTGESLAGPSLTDGLLATVRSARRCLGYFGTHYRWSIAPERMQALVGDLMAWLVPTGEDAAVFAGGRSNVVTVGEWLVTATAMVSPSWEASLVVEDLADDATLAILPRFADVLACGADALACALSSARRLGYREERADGTGRGSGRCRALLLDVFGRSFPEEHLFTVERAAVAAYRARVQALQGRMATLLETLLK